MELSFRVPTLPQVADFAAWKGEADCNERNSPAARNLLKKTILNSSRSINLEETFMKSKIPRYNMDQPEFDWNAECGVRSVMGRV